MIKEGVPEVCERGLLITGRGRASSEDGFASHRPGEVEMQDLFPTRAASRPLPRGPSLPELVSYAGARDGEQADLVDGSVAV